MDSYMTSQFEDRRTGEDRRSNWKDALERLHAQDVLLEELDKILSELYDEGKELANEKNSFDSDELAWADKIAAVLGKYRKLKASYVGENGKDSR